MFWVDQFKALNCHLVVFNSLRMFIHVWESDPDILASLSDTLSVLDALLVFLFDLQTPHEEI